MQYSVVEAKMEYSKEDGYVGFVAFTVQGHQEPYEITLQSKRGREWSYSLHFQKLPGSEEEILAVEEWLEEDDDAFDQLVDEANKVKVSAPTESETSESGE